MALKDEWFGLKTPIHGVVKTSRQGWRRWRPRLRRDRSATLLLALIMIGLGDPMACILHCRLSDLVDAPRSSAGHDHSHHLQSDSESTRPAVRAAFARHDSVLPYGDADCHARMESVPTGIPSETPFTQAHEHLAVLSMAPAPLLAHHVGKVEPRGGQPPPPLPELSLPLRPPINVVTRVQA